MSKWISRRQLVPPAVTADGKIDFDKAREQLGLAVDPIRSAAKASHDSHLAADRQPHGAEVVDFGERRQLLSARTLQEQVKAERAWRELQAEVGKYVLAGDIERAWAQTMGRFLDSVEQSIPDLALALGQCRTARERGAALRHWWRALRAAGAANAAEAAESRPEFVADPDREHFPDLALLRH